MVVITPAPAPAAEAPEEAAETAVVPDTAVTTAVAVEPLPLAAVATSVTYCQCWLWNVGGAGEWTRKLFPTEMMLLGSTGGLAAAHTGIEQSRTPKPKFMLEQRQA